MPDSGLKAQRLADKINIYEIYRLQLLEKHMADAAKAENIEVETQAQFDNLNQLLLRAKDDTNAFRRAQLEAESLRRFLHRHADRVETR